MTADFSGLNKHYALKQGLIWGVWSQDRPRVGAELCKGAFLSSNTLRSNGLHLIHSSLESSTQRFELWTRLRGNFEDSVESVKAISCLMEGFGGILEPAYAAV